MTPAKWRINSTIRLTEGSRADLFDYFESVAGVHDMTLDWDLHLGRLCRGSALFLKLHYDI